MAENDTNSTTKQIVDVMTTKTDYRKRTWGCLDRLVRFPRPVYGRIPNFDEADVAAKKLLDLDEFKSAKSIKISPDKALQAARILALENGKELYVPEPGSRDSFLKKITSDNLQNIKEAVNVLGIKTCENSVRFNDTFHIDLLIVGSVAVSRQGRRIGRGRGMVDVEFAILKELKAIDDATVIITLIVDDMPDDIFQIYDVPIDYILTPTEVIKIEPKMKRPDGIYWNFLTPRHIKQKPILKMIRSEKRKNGIDVTLKQKNIELNNNRGKTRQFTKSNEDENKLSKLRPRKFKMIEKQPLKTDENITNNLQNNVGKKYYRKPHFDFSLMVTNIEKNIRVRHLKDALIQHGIKPNSITWRGYRGFCFLHYAKVKDKVDANTDAKDGSYGVNNVIEILQSLKITPDSTINLKAKVVEPITRIETTDVTSV